MASLRFVEINHDKQNIEILENLPSQIVGHKGEIKPKISNGHISRRHATVEFSEVDGNPTWVITDGDNVSGEASRNGLRDKTGEVILSKITLKDVGDRVYLLYMYNTLAYIEVFTTEIEKVRATKGVDEIDLIAAKVTKLEVNNALVKSQLSSTQQALDNSNHCELELKSKLAETSKAVKTNREQIDSIGRSNSELSNKVDGMLLILEKGLNQVEDVGTNPKPFIIGFAIMLSATLISVFTFGVYINIRPIMESLLKTDQPTRK